MTCLVNGKIEEKQCRLEMLNLIILIILCVSWLWVFFFFLFFWLKSERHKFWWTVRTLEKNYTGSLLLWLAKQKPPKPPKSHHCLPEYFFKNVVLKPEAPYFIWGGYLLIEGYLWWHPQALGKLSSLWAMLPAFFPALGLPASSRSSKPNILNFCKVLC